MKETPKVETEDYASSNENLKLKIQRRDGKIDRTEPFMWLYISCLALPESIAIETIQYTGSCVCNNLRKQAKPTWKLESRFE